MLIAIGLISAVLCGNLFLLLLLLFSILTFLLQSLSGTALSFEQSVALHATVFVIPVAGWLAGEFIRRALHQSSQGDLFARTALIVTCLLCLNEPQLVSYLSAAASFAGEKSGIELAARVVHAAGLAFKAGGVTAAALLLLLAIFELPFIWMCNAFGYTSRAEISIAGLRPAALLFLIVVLFERIAAFFARHLWPAGGIV